MKWLPTVICSSGDYTAAFRKLHIAVIIIIVHNVDCFHTAVVDNVIRRKKYHNGMKKQPINRGVMHKEPIIFVSASPLLDSLRMSAQQHVEEGLSSSTSSSSSSSVATSLVQDFIIKIAESINNETFGQFTMNGPKVTKKTKPEEKERYRGCIKRIHGRLVVLDKKKGNKRKKQQQQQQGEMFLQITVKYHLATDVVKNFEIDSSNNNIELIRGLQILLLPKITNGSHQNNKEFISEWGESGILHNPGTKYGIQSGELQVIERRSTKIDKEHNEAGGKWELDVRFPRGGSSKQKKEQKQKLKWKKSTNSGADINNVVAAKAHDRTKTVPVPNDSLFLQKLGLTVADGSGKPRPGMKSKFRQCQKFVEIINSLVESSSLQTQIEPTSTKADDPSRNINIIDMGCGRGYLTFALHSFLINKYQIPLKEDSSLSSTVSSVNVNSIGIDVRPKLIKEINSITESIPGDDFKQLTFKQGTIESMLLDIEENSNHQYNDTTTDESIQPRSSNGGETALSLDVLIALHACDTATDDALWYGVATQKDIIVVAPCCHKEVRKQLDRHYVKVISKGSGDHPLQDVLRHNIYRERTSESITDSIRGLLLEINNYNIQIFEFIGGEHTSKNVMITATKRNKRRSNKELSNLMTRLRSLCTLHGIDEQKLAKWMNIRLPTAGTAESVVTYNKAAVSDNANEKILTPKSMPPI